MTGITRIHSTVHGIWSLEKDVSTDNYIFISYLSRDCQQMSCFCIKHNEISEDVEARIGRRRRVPAVVIKKARKALQA